MKPKTRRIVQSFTYEGIAISLVGPALVVLFQIPTGTAVAYSILGSVCALAWNYVFNGIFEYWEASQPKKGRSLSRRLLHAAGFEGGLVVMLVPVMSIWFEIPLIEALVADIGMSMFFTAYSFAFTWAFDSLVGLPMSAMQPA